MTDRRPDDAPFDRRVVVRDDPARAAHHDAVYTFARACEIHDGTTGTHILRIRHIVEAIALELELDPDDAEALGYDAMLHDVGKLSIPAEILRKPDELTEMERRLVRSHTIQGERMLSDRSSMRRAAEIARSHHECWNGSGYPDGLAGEAIPLGARITAAADVLDALIADRSYKAAWSYGDAIERVRDLAGSQLDPTIVTALCRAGESGRLAGLFETD